MKKNISWIIGGGRLAGRAGGSTTHGPSGGGDNPFNYREVSSGERGVAGGRGAVAVISPTSPRILEPVPAAPPLVVTQKKSI